MKILAALLILTVAGMGCATTQPDPPRLFLTDADAATLNAPLAPAGPSGWQIATAILLLPLLIPVLALASSSRGPGVSCSGKSWADGTKWKSSCY